MPKRKRASPQPIRKDAHGLLLVTTLSELLPLPSVLIELIRDYMLIAPGTYIYALDYGIRHTWDSEYHVVQYGDYRLHGGKIRVKYCLHRRWLKKPDCQIIWILESLKPDYPYLVVSGIYCEARTEPYELPS